MTSEQRHAEARTSWAKKTPSEKKASMTKLCDEILKNGAEALKDAIAKASWSVR